MYVYHHALNFESIFNQILKPHFLIFEQYFTNYCINELAGAPRCACGEKRAKCESVTDRIYWEWDITVLTINEITHSLGSKV